MGADVADVFRGLSFGCGVVPGTGSMSLKPTVNNENYTPRERIHIPPWGLAEHHRLRSAGDWMGYVMLISSQEGTCPSSFF